jgi:L-malate glycosyltransferase
MSAESPIKALHLIGSKKIAGAERAFFSILESLQAIGVNVEAGVRRGGELAKHAPAGLLVHELGMHTVWDPLSKWEIGRLIAARSPDIVQTHMGRATRLTRVWGRQQPLHIAQLCGHYAVKNFRHADHWLACTHWVADYLIRGGVPASRIHLIPNFIPEPSPVSEQQVDELRRVCDVTRDALTIAVIGRLVPVKGVDVLLKAFARLPVEVGGRPLILVVAGDGPLRAELESLAQQLGVAGRVRFIGWQRAPESAFALADVIAFPSHRHEGFGLVILEAWAARKPLVTTRALGPAEITTDGENALQVDCGDEAAMAAALLSLLNDPALAQRLGRQGRETFESTYSESVVARRYKDLYEELLGR